VSEHSTVVEKCGELIDNALAQLFSPTGRMLCAINQIALPQVLLVPFGNLTAWIMAKHKRNFVKEGLRMRKIAIMLASATLLVESEPQPSNPAQRSASRAPACSPRTQPAWAQPSAAPTPVAFSWATDTN